MIALRQPMQSFIWRFMWLPVEYLFLPPKSNKQTMGDAVSGGFCALPLTSLAATMSKYSFPVLISFIPTICSSAMSIPHPNSLDWKAETITPRPPFFGSNDLLPEEPTHCILLKEIDWRQIRLVGRWWLDVHLQGPASWDCHQIQATAHLHTVGDNRGHWHRIQALLLSPN